MMRKFFFRRLRRYIQMFMIPTALLMICCLVYVVYSHSASIGDKTKRSAESMYEGVETLFRDAVYPYNLVLVNPTFSLGMRKLLSRSEISYTEHTYVYNTLKLIQTTINTHPYISSTYFQIDGYEEFYSSKDGMMNLNTYADTDWYRTLQEMDVSTGKFTQYRQVRFNQFDTREYVSVYDKMPTINGSFVVNINYQDFFDKLKNLPDQNEMLFILNTRGDKVVSVPGDRGLTDQELAQLNNKLDKYGPQPLKAKWFPLGKRLYCISTIQDEEYGLTYISMISSGSFFDRFMMIGVWIGMLLLIEILVIIIICYLLTKESFSHINQVLKLFADAENGIYPGENKEAAEDEYDLVLMNVVKFFLNTTFLKSQLEQQKLKKESAEMAALQLQISPHFLFNTLQALNFEIQKQLGGYQQVNGVMDELSAILQFALNPANHLVTLEDELEKLKKYAGIQKFRFKDSLVFYYEVEDEALGVYVPKMILQPLVENSISHGILPRKEVGYIKVRAFIRQEQLWVTVIDTGIGMPRERIEQICRNMADLKNKNIGLANVNRRLVLNYGEMAALKIISRQGRGTCITFRIPVGLY